jgi:hypothetical protein
MLSFVTGLIRELSAVAKDGSSWSLAKIELSGSL